jgi:hypothetical protein
MNKRLEESLKLALAAGVITFDIDKIRKALVLAVPVRSELVEPLDAIFSATLATVVSLDQRPPPIEPTSVFKIDSFTVSPAVRPKRIRDDYYLYDFLYTSAVKE